MSEAIAAPTIPGPDPDTRAPMSQLPAGSCDCHAHLFGPQTRFPYAASRRYTPPDASLDAYLGMLAKLGIDRAVLVQPSVYLTDNAALLDALSQNRFPLRGIAVVKPDISDAELERMHQLGVRGLRLNLRNNNGAPAEAAPALAKRVAPFGWHLQFRIDPKDFEAAEQAIEALPVEVVVDHIGQVPVGEGIEGPSFQALLRLVRGGRVWVKLSAPMRMSAEEYPYADVTPFVQALVAAAPDQMVWATDWPHTTLTKRMPNDGDLVDLLPVWIPDEQVRNRVLVDNPARLYGF